MTKMYKIIFSQTFEDTRTVRASSQEDAIEKLNLSKSRSDTKRLIKSRGIKVNNEIFLSPDLSLKAYYKLSEIKISVLIDDKYKELAIRSLHAAFKLYQTKRKWTNKLEFLMI